MEQGKDTDATLGLVRAEPEGAKKTIPVGLRRVHFPSDEVHWGDRHCVCPHSAVWGFRCLSVHPHTHSDTGPWMWCSCCLCLWPGMFGGWKVQQVGC